MMNAVKVLNVNEKSPHFHVDSRMMQVMVGKQGAYNIIKIISENAFRGLHDTSAAIRLLRGVFSPLRDCPSE